MPEPKTIDLAAVYWGPRRESLDACADRLVSFMSALASCDPIFENWYEKGYSRKRALERRVDWSNRAVLRNLLDRGRSYTDCGERTLMEDLGFSDGIWNGGDDDNAVSLSITCGLFTDVGLCNSVVLDLPDSLGSLSNAKNMRRVLEALATAWDPDHGCVCSSYSREHRDFSAARLFVDWMVYASERECVIPEIPPPAEVHRIPDRGAIVVVQPEPVDPEEPERLTNVERVCDALPGAT